MSSPFSARHPAQQAHSNQPNSDRGQSLPRRRRPRRRYAPISCCATSYSTPLPPAIGWARNSPAYRPKYVPDGAEGTRCNRWVQRSVHPPSTRILKLSQHPRYWRILTPLLLITSHHPQLRRPQRYHLCCLQNRNRATSLTGSYEPLSSIERSIILDA
jgi:hypothetical protein